MDLPAPPASKLPVCSVTLATSTGTTAPTPWCTCTGHNAVLEDALARFDGVEERYIVPLVLQLAQCIVRIGMLDPFWSPEERVACETLGELWSLHFAATGSRPTIRPCQKENGLWRVDVPLLAWVAPAGLPVNSAQQPSVYFDTAPLCEEDARFPRAAPLVRTAADPRVTAGSSASFPLRVFADSAAPPGPGVFHVPEFLADGNIALPFNSYSSSRRVVLDKHLNCPAM